MIPGIIRNELCYVKRGHNEFAKTIDPRRLTWAKTFRYDLSSLFDKQTNKVIAWIQNYNDDFSDTLLV